MAAPLLIRIAPPGGEPCAWRAADTATASGSLAEAAQAASGRRVLLLIPGSEVLLTTAQVPAKSRAKARAAIPWVLEDRLVAEVEDLQFALGEAVGEGVWHVAVIARARLDAHLSACRAAGIEPAAVVPEPLALPHPGDGGWTLLEEPQQVSVRSGDEAGFACEPDLLGVIASTLAQPERLERHRVGTAESQPDWSPALEDVIAASASPVEHRDALTAFDSEAADGALDLLQGDYSRTERSGRSLRRWRVPAAIAATLLVVILAEAVIAHWTLGQRETALRAEVEQTFRDAFPEAQRVVNPRAQMETRVEQLRGGGQSGFAERLAQAGTVVSRENGARLTGLTWREGVLELELDAEGLQVLDSVQRALQEVGLNAEIAAADSAGEQVAGRIRLAAAGG
ncbi:MAG: type II secretion system protein GspL [Halofilum sp. (in: g-proteobacteria)]